MQIFQVVIIGILLVFIILMVLTLIMMLFPKFVNKKSKQESKETVTLAKTAETNTNTKPTTIDDYTLISVITAAIATYRGSTGENADINSFRVVAFRKVKKNKI